MLVKHLKQTHNNRTFTAAQTGYKVAVAKPKLEAMVKEGVLERARLSSNSTGYRLTAATLETFSATVSYWAD